MQKDNDPKDISKFGKTKEDQGVLTEKESLYSKLTLTSLNIYGDT